MQEKACIFAWWPATRRKRREVADTLVRTANIGVHGVALDLRDPAAPAQAIAQAVEHFGRLDLLVNSAGVPKRADFFSLTEEHWQDGFALRFHGHVRMTRAAWPRVRESNVGVVHIVGVGSRSESAEFTIGGSVSVALLNFTKAMTDISTEHKA